MSVLNNPKIRLALTALLWLLGGAVFFKVSWIYSGMYSDFAQNYASALSLQRGQSIYGTHLTELIAAEIGFEGGENFHPPFASIIYTPFIYLPYRAAYFIWCVFLLGMYFNIISRLSKQYRLPSNYYSLVLPASLLWFPFVANIGLGQISIILSWLILLCFQAVGRGDQIRAGLFAVFACLLKLFPGILVFYFLLRGQWRAFITFVASFLGFCLMTYIIVGSDDVMYYLNHVVRQNVEVYGVYILNTSVVGFLHPLLRQNGFVKHLFDSPEAAMKMSMAVCGALLVWSLYRVRQLLCEKNRSSTDAAFLIFVPLMQLLSPISWTHMFPVLLLPYACFASRWGSLSLQMQGMLAIGAVCLSFPDTFFFGWLIDHFLPERIPTVLFVGTRFGFCGLLIVWGALVSLNWKREQVKSESDEKDIFKSRERSIMHLKEE